MSWDFHADSIRRRGTRLVAIERSTKEKRPRYRRSPFLRAEKQLTGSIRFQNPKPLAKAPGCTSNSYCGEPTRADEWIVGIGQARAYIRALPARTQLRSG